MKALIKILLISVVLQSCDIKKEASKKKNDIDYSEWIKTETFRKGDTVTYVVPNVIYKDTVITTTSTQGTILKTYYNSAGQISKSDCISSEIAEIQETLRTLKDNSILKTSEKTEGFNNSFILYIVIGVLILLMLKKS